MGSPADRAILPSSTINHAVEHWIISEDDKAAEEEDDSLVLTMGENYEVVVRLSKRLGGSGQSVLAWKGTKEALRQHSETNATQVFKVCEETHPKKILKTLKKEKPIAVAFSQRLKPSQIATILYDAGDSFGALVTEVI